ncbi:zinc finger protein [Loa loa]|nr:zinc finger protein [Loa loa]EJD73265.1 zinc finger protein [Loa loa]
MGIHTDKMSYSCEVCGQVFKRKPYLKSHMKTHNKNRPLFNCTVCGKCYLNYDRLNLHKKNHERS